MRHFGWAVALVVGGYTAFLLLKSIPDMKRYIKMTSM
jgi:hypothetical protein